MSSPGSPAGSPQQSGPFNSLDPNTVSSFSSPQPQPSTNGFAFGQSQSFPGAANPTQSNQNGSSQFSFGSGGGGSSFNFSSFGSAPSPANPFTSMSTGTPNQPSTGGAFGGFGGSTSSFGASGNQASNQQPLPSTGLFGSQSNNAAPFGNATSGPSAPATPATAGRGFGQSTPFGAAPSTSLFGQSTSAQPPQSVQATSGGGGESMQTSPDDKGTKAAAKPSLFGNAPTPKTSFGTSTSFGTPTSAAPASTTAPVSSPFAASSPKPAPNLFQHLSTPANGLKDSEEKKDTENKANAAPAKSPFQFTPSTTAGPSLFSKSESAAPATTSGGILGGTPAFGTSQPPSSGDAQPNAQKPFATLFPATPNNEAKDGEKKAPATTSGGPFGMPAFGAAQSPSSSSAGANPFTSLMNHKPATPTKDNEETVSKTPAATPGGIFGGKPAFAASQPPSTGNLFAPKPPVTADQPPSKEAAPGAISNPFAPKLSDGPAAHEKPSETNAQKPFPSLMGHKPATPGKDQEAKKAAAPPDGIFGGTPGQTETSTELPAAQAPQGGVPASSTKPTTTKRDPAQAFANLRPRKVPANLSPEAEEEYVLLHRVRTLNECFKREITKLDPAEDDFDRVVQFYTRVRETLNIPLGFRKTKRKTPDEAENVEQGPSQKKIKPFGPTSSGEDGIAATPSASDMKLGPNSVSNTPSKLFGAEQPAMTGHKRKSIDEGNDETEPSAHREKRTKDGEASSTANVFAQSFSNSTGPSPKEHTPAAPTAAPAFEIPKFGSGSSGETNFLSQFKKQADQDAAKEKEKRKAEDFDSDEDDEAEWERKDAEEQRKKREELAALSQKRTKFVPGKGFVFEDGTTELSETTDTQPKESEPKEPESKEPEQSISSTSSESKSIFESDSAPPKENNIFGHLSPSPLFGAKSEPSGSKTTTSSLSPGFSFGGPIPQGTSGLTPAPSSDASRATTPGITSDTGAEESGEGETAESLPQAELARGGAGEENEDVILETRARALQFKDGGWESQGVGFFRILKDRTTSRARILLRADPSGKVVLNAHLMKELTYSIAGTAVQFLVPQSGAPPQQWAIRARKGEVEQLAKEMEGAKS